MSYFGFGKIKAKTWIFALISVAIASISPYFVGPGSFFQTPIYVWIAANIGIPPIGFVSIVAVLTWFFLGALPKRIAGYSAILLSIFTSFAGLWWLVESRKYITPDFTSEFFFWVSFVFLMSQISCWIFSLRFKRIGDLDSRAVLTVALTLNICWSMMPYYGIH